MYCDYFVLYIYVFSFTYFNKLIFMFNTMWNKILVDASFK